VYRIAGLLTDTKTLLTTRSTLRTNMLDCLHRANIEIVSPTFMNQRVQPPDRTFIPRVKTATAPPKGETPSPEAVVFDKADEAESLEKLQERQKNLGEEIDRLKASLGNAQDENAKAAIEVEIEKLRTRLERLAIYIDERRKGD